MFEDKNFEKLLEEKLKNIKNDVDKREGSVVWDATAGNSLETAQMYAVLAEFYKETFGSTASRENLIKRAAERGIIPKPASYRVYKGEFDNEVSIGTRFNLDEYNFVVVKKIQNYEYELRCETIGEEPNGTTGDLIPIDYIQGIKVARITEMLVPGEDEEDTESIRKRYYDSFDVQAYGGNIKDYEEKTLAINGVGAVKVTPVWKGGGTVRLTILDSDFNTASSTLIGHVQTIIDPTKDATGQGLAPIGHIVTVDTPEKETIYIATNLTLEGISVEQIKNEIDTVLKNYLLEMRKKYGTKEKLIIRISQIESKILAISDKIIDIENTKINGYAKNFEVDKYKVPVWGDTNYETS